MTERLIQIKYNGIVSRKREETGISCSTYCDLCSQGGGNCEYVSEMIKKLAEYENAEEEGKLVVLPCKVGDVLYKPTRSFVSEYEVRFIEVSSCNCLFLHTSVVKGINDSGETFKEDDIGKKVFLTKEEAEKALKEMEAE